MFIAIDELAKAVDTSRPSKAVLPRFTITGFLGTVCGGLLDAAKLLRISDAERNLPMSATQTLGVYERYVCGDRRVPHGP
jgi:hypothetical protein